MQGTDISTLEFKLLLSKILSPVHPQREGEACAEVDAALKAPFSPLYPANWFHGADWILIVKKPSEIRTTLKCLRQEHSSGFRVEHGGSGSREAMRRAAMTATPSCSIYADSTAIRGKQIMFPFLQKFMFFDRSFLDFLQAAGLQVY
jgi:hypothetical protein